MWLEKRVVLLHLLSSDVALVGRPGARLHRRGDAHNDELGSEAHAKRDDLHAGEVLVALQGRVSLIDEAQEGPLVNAARLQRWRIGGHEASLLRPWALLRDHNGQRQWPSHGGHPSL